MKPNKIEVAKRLYDIKLQLNLSFSHFGDKIGVSKSTVNSWVRGLALPPMDKLRRIAFLANTTVDWILWGDEKSIPMTQTSHIKCSSCSSVQEKDIYELTKDAHETVGVVHYTCEQCHAELKVSYEFYPYIKTSHKVEKDVSD